MLLLLQRIREELLSKVMLCYYHQSELLFLHQELHLHQSEHDLLQVHHHPGYLLKEQDHPESRLADSALSAVLSASAASASPKNSATSMPLPSVSLTVACRFLVGVFANKPVRS